MVRRRFKTRCDHGAVLDVDEGKRRDANEAFHCPDDDHRSRRRWPSADLQRGKPCGPRNYPAGTCPGWLLLSGYRPAGVIDKLLLARPTPAVRRKPHAARNQQQASAAENAPSLLTRQNVNLSTPPCPNSEALPSRCQTIKALRALRSCHCRYGIAYPRCHRQPSPANEPLLPRPPRPPPAAASPNLQIHSPTTPTTLLIPTHLLQTTTTPSTSELPHHPARTLVSRSAPQAAKPATFAPLAISSPPRPSDSMPSPRNSPPTAAPPSAPSTCAVPPSRTSTPPAATAAVPCATSARRPATSCAL